MRLEVVLGGIVTTALATFGTFVGGGGVAGAASSGTSPWTGADGCPYTWDQTPIPVPSPFATTLSGPYLLYEPVVAVGFDYTQTRYNPGDGVCVATSISATVGVVASPSGDYIFSYDGPASQNVIPLL